MRTIVFIDCNKSGSSREAIRAADRLGYLTVLLTSRERFFMNRTEFPDVHQMLLCDVSDRQQLEQMIEKLLAGGKQIAAIVSFLESYVLTAAELSAKYCRPLLSTEAIHTMEDKILTRNALQDTPYCPYYTTWEVDEALSDCIERTLPHLPLVVKSPTSTGSKDVLKATTRDQLNLALTTLRMKFPDQPLLIEEYLDGPQFLVEAVVIDRNVHVVAVIEQDIQLLKNFLVMGYDVLTDADMVPEFQEAIHQAVRDIVHCFGLQNGALHLEMRYVREQWKLIEGNPRISGGAMNRMIEVAKGINLVEETLRLILGEQPNLEKRHDLNTFTKYLTVQQTGILRMVTGRNRAKRIPKVAEVFIKPRRGQKVRFPESMGHRYAYVIATGESRLAARLQAEAAVEEIQFHISPYIQRRDMK